MEKRIKQKVNDYILQLKEDVIQYIQDKNCDNADKNMIVNYITNYTTVQLEKEDFVRRKRVKNVVPFYERCQAKRANGEQCTRRRRKKQEGDCKFCGTHVKGQPHGVISENKNEATFKKITVFAQDIKGIIYYLDNNNNVYDNQDIMDGVRNPKIIAKYQCIDNEYIIPEFC